MFRLPVKSRIVSKNSLIRMKSSSSFIRSTFIENFVQNHGHKHVKSSSVVPLCDPSVPFVNAGMNQFKGVFLGKVDPPCPRAVNSQKCIRVGGKHNDLDVVGTDGHHHTFFEMLGNWSFGDYYKKEACKMAWDLLLGPYRFKPEQLVVTYFSGDAVLNLQEDRECRDIWKQIGVPTSRLRGLGAADNFWEMGASGPCGPCTEIHYVHPDGSLTEIWNIVFIQCNREADGSVKPLRRLHVDTGLGLERVTALLQGVPSNYDTDLFQPIIRAIERHSGGAPRYSGRWDSAVDAAYRRLADHARMVAVCLADGVFPATSLNLKQIMRKSFKISTEVFKNSHLLTSLYDEVAATLGPTYPELVTKSKEVKMIMEHEEQAYGKMRGNLEKKWRELLQQYPEVEGLEVETAGFALGYKEFKETMATQNSTVIPGELVFKLYDTHGFQDDIIQTIANLNNLTIDKEGFQRLLTQHRTRHKTAIKEQTSNRGQMFDKTIDNLIKNNITSTNDQHKYNYTVIDNKVKFEPLKTKLVAILNEDGEWIDVLEPCDNRPYYLVTEDTNFYCEEGGQTADSGEIVINDQISLKVDTVFKICDFVFHKGCFRLLNCDTYVKRDCEVSLRINSERRLNTMRNHTAVHLLNAAIRKVLPNSVVYQVGSSVTDKGLSLNLTVYGEKLSQDVVMKAQELVRESIQSDTPFESRFVDSLQLSSESALTVPGETYPETGLRLVYCSGPLPSKELCCGTHAPRTALLGEFCVTTVRAANGNSPQIHAITGDAATEARELFCKSQHLHKVTDLLEPERCRREATSLRERLAALCAGSGAPYAEYRQALDLLARVHKRSGSENTVALHAIAEAELAEAESAAAEAGRGFVVHFLRCSYVLPRERVAAVLRAARPRRPAALLACAGGEVSAACIVPEEHVSMSFSAERWLRAVLPVFAAQPAPAPAPLRYAEMTATKVSLITCEQLVQEALAAATQFAQQHMHGDGAHGARGSHGTQESHGSQESHDTQGSHGTQESQGKQGSHHTHRRGQRTH